MKDDTLSVRRLRPLLGTWVEIQATGRSTRVERAVKSAFLHIARVQERMSFHAPDSVLSRINLHAHHTPQPVDAWTWDVLRKSRALSLASEGRFDITLGARLVERGVLPDHGFATLEAAVGSDALVMWPGRRVGLRRPVLLTLDGIAKGYAVDLAIQSLQRAGIDQAVVNAGGDLRAFGPHAVPLGIRLANGAVYRAGSLCNAAVASSMVGHAGSARQNFPGCVLHPGGGNWRGAAPKVWTVQAESCWRADALTKVAALSPPTRRHILVAQLGGRILPTGSVTAREEAA